ncbi:tol-pal system-associated acyl-CoA thioesterase [Hirschia baltica]|uniref:Tol-pal system-associated acyl-CoA thioesterase n=1 Tax=Hirschia baltica (strain ATCC 49814 / DSM 5838 / IFAM 1418) TaxID=582402 RepID=C6XNC8_HIRBI|nr:tol-pal system-associated acyl-CoA thioesterase [Hirschia baltica]ACT60072.1 tol-pal system-associated acyl-CoA thioesterase [Hirschia baltica ATCC 49814]
MNDQPEAGRIEIDEHILPVRVYYEDTDFTGVVYHANYLKFFERGRSDFLRFAGMSHEKLAQEQNPLAFAVARMEIDFKRPAKIDDALTVHTRFVGSKGARLLFNQKICRNDTLLCSADVTIVQINMDGQLIRPTKELLSAWGQFQSPN